MPNRSYNSSNTLNQRVDSQLFDQGCHNTNGDYALVYFCNNEERLRYLTRINRHIRERFSSLLNDRELYHQLTQISFDTRGCPSDTALINIEYSYFEEGYTNEEDADFESVQFSISILTAREIINHFLENCNVVREPYDAMNRLI